MGEIDKNKLEVLKKEVGFEEVAEYSKKEVNIIKDTKQFSIRVPKRFAEIMAIDEQKDRFEFHLRPNDKGHLELEAKLIKG